MQKLSPGEWGILRDYDCLYTTSSYGELIYFHCENTKANFFTCLTNRAKCVNQKDLTAPQSNDYELHRQHGLKLQQSHFRRTTDITDGQLINGFWMCIKKELWDRIEPPGSTQLLGVDSHIHKQIRKLRERIILLRGLYLYHYYNNANSEEERNISHLK